VCVCVCVCVRERERERFVCVFVYVRRGRIWDLSDASVQYAAGDIHLLRVQVLVIARPVTSMWWCGVRKHAIAKFPRSSMTLENVEYSSAGRGQSKVPNYVDLFQRIPLPNRA
jgi:hypothetical protein